MKDETKMKLADTGWKLFLWTVAIAITIGTVVAILIWIFLPTYCIAWCGTDSAFEFSFTITWIIIWSVLSVAYIAASWRVWDVIGPDEIAVSVLLGKPIATLESGPPFAPIGLVEIIRYPTTTAQKEHPTEPELIYRPLEGQPETAPAGMRPPLRITFANKPLTEEMARKVFGDSEEDDHSGQNGLFKFNLTQDGTERTYQFDDYPGDSEDGLSNSRVTLEVPHISRFRINNPIQFTIAVPPHPETGSRVDEVFRQMEDEQVIALNTILAQLTVAQAYRNISWINAALFKKVCKRIKADDRGHSEEYGVDLEGAALKPFLFNRDLNQAITGVAEATFQATATIRTGEANKQVAILTGEGAAQAARDLERETLVGRGTGLKALADNVAASERGSEVLAAEVARDIGEAGNTIVVGPEGLGQLAGLAAAAMNKKPKKEEDGK